MNGGIPLTKDWHIKTSRPNFFVAVSTKTENDLDSYTHVKEYIKLS